MNFKKLILISLFIFYSLETNAKLLDKNNKEEAIYNFGFNLFQTLNNKENNENNILISPLSISCALTLTLNGANGETFKAMQKTLCLNNISLNDINEFYKKNINLINKNKKNDKIIVNIANSIWYQNKYLISKNFLNIANKNYFSEVIGGNFDKEIIKKINNWVEKKTNNKIKNMLSDSDIDKDNVLFILNSIYFNGKWKYKFDEKLTFSDYFYSPYSKKHAKCLFMHQENNYKYYETDNFQMIDIPYADDDFSMLIFLPKEGTDINYFLTKLDYSNLNEWIENLKEERIDLYLPKFKIEYSETLNEYLKILGMGIAFSNKADFSNLFTTSGISIDKIKHKTFIEVTESGTEAAGTTSISFRKSYIPESKIMKINKPFILFIKDKSNIIYFSGKIVELK